MLFNKNYKRNSKRLIEICCDLIEKYQANSLKPSCKNDLMNTINDRLVESKDEISEWKDYDTDYIKIAHTLLANASFDLLASGQYHLHYGVLNPMSCANNLMDVYKASMKYALNNNYIDEATLNEQYNYLLQCISSVG